MSYASDVTQAVKDDKPVVILLEDASDDDENENSPLISTSARLPSDMEMSATPSPELGAKIDQKHKKEKVKFQLGMTYMFFRLLTTIVRTPL